MDQELLFECGMFIHTLFFIKMYPGHVIMMPKKIKAEDTNEKKEQI